MKKTKIITTAAALLFASAVGAQPAPGVAFSSPDTALCRTFEWAKATALGYAHHGGDKVGCWYEAALPARAAFCMRDVSHQCVGAEVLGLSRHNVNMMSRFAASITPERDWCGLWEIDKDDAPAEADYVDDQQFWYNLNGGADVVFACERLYQWTGDAHYLTDSVMVNFYEKTLGEFILRWQLAPDQLLYRVRNMNTRLPFDPARRFNHARGIPSYAEDVQGFSMSLDLIAALYAGHEAYARMLDARGDAVAAERFRSRAEAYRHQINGHWWSPDSGFFHAFWDSNRGIFLGNYPANDMYAAWFGATSRPEQLQAVFAEQIANRRRSAEIDSYIPALLYRGKYTDAAYEYLLTLPHIHRSEYPEVSYGAIEAIALGVMGIAPSASGGYVRTLAQLGTRTPWAEIGNVPLLGTRLRVRHDGNTRTTLTNQGHKSLVWRVAFYGDFETIAVGGKRLKALRAADMAGNSYSYADIRVEPGKRFEARAL